MTDEQIMALQGRELDEAVAQMIGWERVHGHPSLVDGEWWSDPDNPGRYVYEVPRYSTDIAAAWRVVEWMMRRGWHLSLIGLTASGQSSWSARWDLGDVSHLYYGTAPEAICKAALLAMHVQHGKNGGDGR